MLSVSIDEYSIPTRMENEEQGVFWRLRSVKGEDSILARTFNYTFRVIQCAQSDSEGVSPGRMTFTYNGSSVKATPRTLRIYGSECISSITSVLCSWNEDERVKFARNLVKSCNKHGWNITAGKEE